MKILLAFAISIFTLSVFACDACLKSKIKTQAVGAVSYDSGFVDNRSHSQRLKDTGMVPGEYIICAETNPAPWIPSLKPNQVHRCGQMSSKQILACKCGALVHTWVPTSSAQYNSTAAQKAALKEKNIRNAKNSSTVNNIKTAAANYKP